MGRGAPAVEYELTFYTQAIAENMRTGRPTSRPGATDNLAEPKPNKEAHAKIGTHAANNSFLNVVLESKKGNPISLCVIYMWIAQKLGYPIYGVNLPNLFVLTYKQKEIQFYINVFNKGLIFNRVDIDNYLAQLNLTPNDIYYNPCSNLEIIRRVLRNLIMAYEKSGDEDYKAELTDLIASLD
jgi:regulator of sirC expression with transglutaminase-like and TPR domain